MTGTEAFCPAFMATGTAGTFSPCPVHCGAPRGNLSFSAKRDSRDKSGTERNCPDWQGGRQPGQPGHTPLRSVPLSRPDAEGFRLAVHGHITQAARNSQSAIAGGHRYRLYAAMRSRASLRWAGVELATAITTTAATSIHMGSPLNHWLQSSITAAKQQQKRRKTAVFWVLPRPMPPRVRRAAAHHSTQKFADGFRFYGR